MELAYTLADEDPGVRRAAFHLAGRLKDRQVAELLLDYARHSESELALPAIRFLGKLKPEGAVEVLVSLLGSSKDRKRLIACCRALGQIADPAGLEPLARLVAPRRFLFLRRKPDHSLRAAAALALSRIPHPRAAEILAPLVDDLDPRVRELARTQPGKQ